MELFSFKKILSLFQNGTYQNITHYYGNLDMKQVKSLSQCCLVH